MKGFGLMVAGAFGAVLVFARLSPPLPFKPERGDSQDDSRFFQRVSDVAMYTLIAFCVLLFVVGSVMVVTDWVS
jgi:hypothetical protein